MCPSTARKLHSYRLACSCFFIFSLLCCFLSANAAEPNKKEVPQKAAPKTLLEQAKAHFDSSRHAQAEKLLLEYLRAQPNAPDAAQSYLLLGQTQEKQSRSDDAERTFKGLVSRFPNTESAAQAIEQQALIHTKGKNPSAAQKFREELLLRYPTSPTTARVWSAEADALFAADEFEKSIAIYQKIEKSLSPKSLEKLTTARILATGDGDPAKILPIAENALNKNNHKLAKTLFTYLSESPKASRELPRILTKLGWCIFLEGGEENNKQAGKLWLQVISSTQPSNPWYA